MSTHSTNPEDENFDPEAAINDLDRKLARLRVLYEQYFMGIEKRPPDTPLKQVVRLIYVLENLSIKNTALKFRLRSLVQKFQSYRSYWNRTAREIENGTYRRHIQKLRSKERRAAAGGGEEEVEAELSEADIEELDREQLGLGGATPAPVERPSAASEAANLADDFLRQMGAGSRRQAPAEAAPRTPPGEPVRGVSADDLERRAEALRKLQERLGQRFTPAGASGSRLTTARPGEAAGQAEPATPAAAPQPASPATGTGPAAGAPRAEPTLSRRTLNRPAIQRAGASTSAASLPTAQGAAPTQQQQPQQPAPAQPRGPIQRPGPTAAAPPAGAMGDEGVRRSLEGAGLSERRLQTLYQSLVDAKQRCNEPTNNLSYDSVVRSIAKQAPGLKQKSADGKVDFQVVIKEGKAYLKPVTSRDDA